MWAAIGPGALLEALGPLVRRREEDGPVRLIDTTPDARAIAAAVADAPDTLLVMEPPNAPGGRGAGPSAGATCIGWLRLDARQVAAYADAAVSLAERAADPDPVIVLLGPREPRYLELLDRVEAKAGAAFRWSAERIRPEPMLRALRAGPTAALYVGHGSPEGWSGYRGVTAPQLMTEPWKPDERIAALFSLACGTGASGGFADRLATAGVAGAILAPTGQSRHAGTRRLAPALAAAMARRSDATLAEVLRAVKGRLLAGHVVIGDPATRLRSSAGARRRCEAISAPAADAVLA